MARPKNPENKYEPRHSKLSVPVLDEKGNLMTFDTKSAEDVTGDDIKKVLSLFESISVKDSSFNVDSAIDTVFKLKEDVSESPSKGKAKGKAVILPKEPVSDPSKTGKDETEEVTSDEDEVSYKDTDREEEQTGVNAGDNTND